MVSTDFNERVVIFTLKVALRVLCTSSVSLGTSNERASNNMPVLDPH